MYRRAYTGNANNETSLREREREWERESEREREGGRDHGCYSTVRGIDWQEVEIAGSSSDLDSLSILPHLFAATGIYSAENLPEGFLWKKISEFTGATFFEEKSSRFCCLLLLLVSWYASDSVLPGPRLLFLPRMQTVARFNGRENGWSVYSVCLVYTV